MTQETFEALEQLRARTGADAAREDCYRLLFQALELSTGEPETDGDALIAAALLHSLAPADAAARLRDGGFPTQLAAAAEACLRDARGEAAATGEARCLHDALQLERCGALGLAQALRQGALAGEALYGRDTAGRIGPEGADSFLRRWEQGAAARSARLLTRRGQALAAQRAAAARDFCAALTRELQEPDAAGQARLRSLLEPEAASASKALEVLSRYFGYPAFRGGQEPIVQALLAGQDALCVMPTGAGKSICYQVPALLMPGITLVISPLIALMKDQVNALIRCGVPAAYLNSSLTAAQYNKALQRMGEGAYKLVYAAPERLLTPQFLSLCQSLPISMVAVDEAHCVSQWGQDFRPGYLNIARFVTSLPHRPVLAAFTATATREVREDIQRLLELEQPFSITTGFDRPNLYFGVVRVEGRSRTRELLRLLDARKGQSGIVYCGTRKAVEEVCDALREAGFAATRYHAGLADEERQANQEEFVTDRCPIMVATNAFGMGIDKSNVSFVIHYQMPKNLEAYYQEAGRAGRDGEAADCILLYSGADVRLNEFLIQNSEPNEALTPEVQAEVRRRDLERLRQMTFYATVERCLRNSILQYFGERTGEDCGNCSVCRESGELVDATGEARAILRCVGDTGQRYGAGIIAAVLKGSGGERTERFTDLGCFGALSALPLKDIRRRIDALVGRGYLELTEGEYPILRLTNRAPGVLEGEERVELRTLRAAKSQKAAAPADADPLLRALKALRLELARKEKIPAYWIFSDATLADMSRRRPLDEAAFSRVSGVGKAKLQRYGPAFLACIRENAP